MGCCTSNAIEPVETDKCSDCPHQSPVKRALVLSGGGSYGAYEVGVLQVLLEKDPRPYDVITGISVGALNGAYLAQSPHGHMKDCIKGLYDLWYNLKQSQVYVDWCWPCGVACALCKPSVYDSRPLHKLVAKVMDVDKIRKSGREFRVGAVCLETGKYVEYNQNDNCIKDAVIASSSFPAFLLPAEIDGKQYSDGGLRNIVAPIQKLIKQGVTEIDCIACSPEDVTEFKSMKDASVLKLAARISDIMCNEIENDDLDVGLPPNVKMRLFRPQKQLGPDPLRFAHDELMSMIKVGHADAERILGTPK